MTREQIKNLVLDHLAGRITCHEFVDEVTDYLEGALGLLRWVRFQMHLGICRGCRNYLKQMRGTIQTIGRLPELPAPPEVRDELLRRFRARHTHGE